MKKVLLAFICLMVSIAVFAGCSGTESNSPEESESIGVSPPAPIPVNSIEEFHRFLLAYRQETLPYGVIACCEGCMRDAIRDRIFGEANRYYIPAWLPEGFNLDRISFHRRGVTFFINIVGFDEDQNFIHEYLLNNQITFTWFIGDVSAEYRLSSTIEWLGLQPVDGVAGLYYYDYAATQDPSVNLTRSYHWIQDGYVFRLEMPLWIINHHAHSSDGFGAASIGDSIADLVMNSALAVELVDGVSYVEPTDIEIVDPGVDIAIGETLELIANVYPENVTIDAVVWRSGNNRVATVTQSGIVTRLSEGPVTITARAVASNMNAIFELGGANYTILPESITLSHTEASVYVGNTFELTATILPENATDQAVVWSSDNESIATVSQTGVVTGVSVGTATITATAANGVNDSIYVTFHSISPPIERR